MAANADSASPGSMQRRACVLSSAARMGTTLPHRIRDSRRRRDRLHSRRASGAGGALRHDAGARAARSSICAATGLRIKGLAELPTPVQVLTDASQLRGAEVLIVAMKTPGTAEALEPLRNCGHRRCLLDSERLWKNEALAQRLRRGARARLSREHERRAAALGRGAVHAQREHLHRRVAGGVERSRRSGSHGRSMRPACAPRPCPTCSPASGPSSSVGPG